MSVKKLNAIFGRKPDPAKEKAVFVQRLNQTALKIIDDHYPRGSMFRHICYELGLNADDIIAAANQYNIYGDEIVPPVRQLTQDDFFTTLQVLVSAYGALPDYENEKLNVEINLALALAVEDIGIIWKEGLFYPLGAQELDQKLIGENLTWLKSFPQAESSYRAALDHFALSLKNDDKRKDAVTNAYTALEALGQKFLGNKKTFDNNSDLVVEKLGLPTEYKNILHYYKLIANGHSSRHPGVALTHEETEAFIYLTGVILRLIIQKITP